MPPELPTKKSVTSTWPAWLRAKEVIMSLVSESSRGTAASASSWGTAQIRPVT